MNKILEIFGWYGTVAIIAAYFLNSFGLIESSSLIYQLLNATGAIGIVLISLQKKAWQPMTLNIIWFTIGVIAIIKSLI